MIVGVVLTGCCHVGYDKTCHCDEDAAAAADAVSSGVSCTSR